MNTITIAGPFSVYCGFDGRHGRKAWTRSIRLVTHRIEAFFKHLADREPNAWRIIYGIAIYQDICVRPPHRKYSPYDEAFALTHLQKRVPKQFYGAK